MSHRRRYDFTEIIPGHTVTSRVDMEEAPTIDRLQGMFEDLYLQRRIGPSHLFMNEANYKALNDELIKACTDDIPEKPSLAQIVNFVNGHYVHVVPASYLGKGNVILGFYDDAH